MTPLERLASLATDAHLQPVGVAEGRWTHPDEHEWPTDWSGPNGRLDRARDEAAAATEWVHAVMPDAVSASTLGLSLTGPVVATLPDRSWWSRLFVPRLEALPLVCPQTVYAMVGGKAVHVVNVPVAWLPGCEVAA